MRMDGALGFKVRGSRFEKQVLRCAQDDGIITVCLHTVFGDGLDVGEGGSDAVGEATDLEVVGVFSFALEDHAGCGFAVGVEAIAFDASIADAVGAIHEVHEALAEALFGGVWLADLGDGREGAEFGVEFEVLDDGGDLAGVGFGCARAGACGVHAAEVVGGEFDAVEEEAGAFAVEGVGGDAGEDVGEGELDGGAVLERGHVEDGLVGDLAEELGGSAGGVVVVAEVLAAEAG
jgi:hypothetical protein